MVVHDVNDKSKYTYRAILPCSALSTRCIVNAPRSHVEKFLPRSKCRVRDIREKRNASIYTRCANKFISRAAGISPPRIVCHGLNGEEHGRVKRSAKRMSSFV